MVRAVLLRCGSLVLVCVVGCGRVGYSPLASVDDAGVADDGVAGDGGTPDATCSDGELACGDFDEDLSGWSIRNAGDRNRVERVDDPVGIGSGALRIQTDRESSDGFVMVERWFPPVRAGTLYLRALLWVGTRTEIGDYVVMLQLDNGMDDGEEKISVDLMADEAIGLAVTTPDPAQRPGSTRGRISRESWMCVTVRIDLDDTSGAVSLAIEDEEVVRLDAVDTVPMPNGFQRLGLTAVGPVPQNSDVAFDAVALSRAPLFCDGDDGPRRGFGSRRGRGR